MGRQMLIKADSKLWLVDGMWRRPVPGAWYANGTGPISDQQVHQAALLGTMGTPYSTGGDLDVWGIDIETRVASRVSAALAPIGDRLNHIDDLLSAAGGSVDNAPVLAAVAELRAVLAAAAHAGADQYDA